MMATTFMVLGFSCGFLGHVLLEMHETQYVLRLQQNTLFDHESHSKYCYGDYYDSNHRSIGMFLQFLFFYCLILAIQYNHELIKLIQSYYTNINITKFRLFGIVIGLFYVHFCTFYDPSFLCLHIPTFGECFHKDIQIHFDHREVRVIEIPTAQMKTYNDEMDIFINQDPNETLIVFGVAGVGKSDLMREKARQWARNVCTIHVTVYLTHFAIKLIY